MSSLRGGYSWQWQMQRHVYYQRPTPIVRSTAAFRQSMHRAAAEAAGWEEERWKDAECCDVAKSTLTARPRREYAS